MSWEVVVVTEVEVHIVIDANAEGMSLVGIPQFRLLSTGAVPVEVALGSATAILVYADPIDPSTSIVLGSQDPAIRGAQGEYLAPQQVPITPNGGAIEIAPSVAGSNAIAMNPTTPLNQILLGEVGGWETVPGAFLAIAWSVDVNNWFLNFAEDISGETGIRHTSDYAQNIALSGARVPFGEWEFS